MLMTNAKKLLTNTLLLTAAAFLMKTVAVSFNVYLTNKIGADGIGLFQLITAVYGMSITFSVAGIRLAAMRIVADNIALGKYNDRQIMRRCLVYSFICGTVIAALLAGFSEFIGSKWIGDVRSVPSLKVLSLSLPFVAMSAALNGYFTSVKKIVRYTAVQLSEQVFKIVVTVFLLKSVITHGLEASCTAIVFGISSAEFFSLVCSYTLYRFSVCKPKETENGRDIWKRILKISIPDTVGSEMRSILMTVEHLLIPVGFRKSGSDPQTALANYGVIHGMLKGLDQQVSYMRYNIIDASICVVLVYLLVPIFSVKGYVIVVFVSEIINFILSFRRLTKVSDVNISFFKDIFIPIFCVIGANLLKNFIFFFFNITNFKLAASLEIIAAVILYTGMIVLFRSIDKEELDWMKSLVK